MTNQTNRPGQGNQQQGGGQQDRNRQQQQQGDQDRRKDQPFPKQRPGQDMEKDERHERGAGNR